MVGPGRYGELTKDGDFADPGEELNAGGAMIVVNKAVSIQSQLGATLTIIDGRGVPGTAVLISTNGAIFGGLKKGFTVTGATATGIDVEANSVTLAGNLALSNTEGTGYVINGSGGTVIGNFALGNSIGFNIGASQSAFRANVAWVNDLVGFSVSGGADIFDRNIASGNGNTGFNVSTVDTGGQFLGNAAIANGENGMALTGTGFIVRDTTAIGNDENGLGLSDPNSSTTGGNLFGNLGCGLRNASQGAVTATKIFFGSPDGPGNDDPADRVCNIGTSTTDTDPFSTKPVKPKVKPLF